MTDPIDWRATTWRENRRRQHLEFLSLTFREKMRVIEDLGEVAAFFQERRQARAGEGPPADSR